MRLTARQLNRATLARQMLLRREAVDVAEAVVALQAQEAASPYLALWNRLADFDPGHLDAAFAGHAVVKATLMRITLHAVHAGDYPAFRGAMLEILRGSRLYDRRFTASGGWSGVTWPGSARPRPPTSRSSPCTAAPPPGTRCVPWPASSRCSKARTGQSCSICPAPRIPAKIPRPRPG
jgi:Winged helix DNA-binding domain